MSVRAAGVLRNVAELELLQAPGLPFSVPRDLACLPLLTGAAPLPRPPLLCSLLHVAVT